MDDMLISADLQSLIERQVAQGHAASAAAFLDEAVMRHAEALERHEDALIAAADGGLADIAAGRFDQIETSEDLHRLRADLARRTDRPSPG